MFWEIVMMLFCILLIYKQNNKFELSSSLIFFLLWFFQVAICFFVEPKYNWSNSLLFIFGCIVIFLLGNIFARKYIYTLDNSILLNSNCETSNNLEINQRNDWIIYVAFWSSFLCGCLGQLLYLRLNGITFYQILTDLPGVNNIMAVKRYQTGDTQTLISQILLSFTYLVPLLGGFIFLFVDKRLYFLLFSLIPVIFVLITSNTKAPLISGSFFLVSSLIVGHLFKYKNYKELSIKLIITLAVLFIVFLGLMFLSFSLRYNYFSLEEFKVILFRIFNYGIGHVFAFDGWFDNYEFTHLDFGKYTFLAIADKLGIAERVQGVYQDYFEAFDGLISTNVFSYFRGFINDFGIIGTLLLFFAIGVLCGEIEYKVQTNKFTIHSYCTLVILLSFLLYWIVSLFTYTSYFICFFLFFIFCSLPTVKANFERVCNGK